MTGNIKTMAEYMKENASLKQQVKELTAPLSEKEQMREQLAAGLDPLIDAQIACHKRQAQNEADKDRVIELLNLRAPLVQLNKDHPDKSKLFELDAELAEVRRRMDFFAAEVRALGEAEKTARRNFAGV